MYRGTCSQRKDVVLRDDPGPVALSAFQGQVALSFLLCRPCLNWLIESARSELKGEQSLPISAEETVGGPNIGGVGGVGSSSKDTVFSCRPTRVVKAKTDITIESGQNNPETLLDLAVVADTQPALNKASLLMSKMPLHLHPMVAAAFATRARGLSPGFRASLPSLAWRRIPEIRLCNASLLAVDIAKLCYFLEAITNLKKLLLIGCKLSEETIGPVSDIMATSQKLEEVDLNWNPIRREGARAVIAALEPACPTGTDGGQVVISAIGAGREHFRLLDLDLAFNTLGAGSGEALATALRRNETLTRLSVRAQIISQLARVVGPR